MATYWGSMHHLRQTHVGMDSLILGMDGWILQMSKVLLAQRDPYSCVFSVWTQVLNIYITRHMRRAHSNKSIDKQWVYRLMKIRTYVFKHVSLSLYLYTSMYTNTNTCIYIYTHTNTCIDIYTYMCIYIYIILHNTKIYM